MELLYRHSIPKPRRRRLGEVDVALLAVIRSVLDDSRSAEQSAAEVRRKGIEDSVLHRVSVRVRVALFDRPTPVAQRALRTLDILLGEAEPAVDGG